MAMWKLWELKDKMEVHWPLIKELLKNMTGRDCEEWIQYWEETYLDGHSFEDVAMWYREGHIDMVSTLSLILGKCCLLNCPL